MLSPLFIFSAVLVTLTHASAHVSADAPSDNTPEKHPTMFTVLMGGGDWNFFEMPKLIAKNGQLTIEHDSKSHQVAEIGVVNSKITVPTGIDADQITAEEVPGRTIFISFSETGIWNSFKRFITRNKTPNANVLESSMPKTSPKFAYFNKQLDRLKVFLIDNFGDSIEYNLGGKDFAQVDQWKLVRQGKKFVVTKTEMKDSCSVEIKNMVDAAGKELSQMLQQQNRRRMGSKEKSTLRKVYGLIGGFGACLFFGGAGKFAWINTRAVIEFFTQHGVGLAGSVASMGIGAVMAGFSSVQLIWLK